MPPSTPSPPPEHSRPSAYASLFGFSVVSRIDTQNAARILNERERQLTTEAVCARCNSLFIELDSIGSLQCAMHPCTKWSPMLIRHDWWPSSVPWNSDRDAYPCCGQLYPWGKTAEQKSFFGGDTRSPLYINGCVRVDHASMRELASNSDRNPTVSIPFELLTRRYGSDGVALFQRRVQYESRNDLTSFVLTKQLYAV